MAAQDFNYFVVIDFEATCDEQSFRYPQEIIEFPSVIVSGRTGELVAYFQTYVRPTHRNGVLTDFCKDLTGIQQTQVDRGITLQEALVKHDRWLYDNGILNTNFAVVTWSDWDCKVMLESECRLKNIPKPSYFNRWINLKLPFCDAFDMARCNLKQAVEKAGLAWEGRAHCGLDDAKNTARLLSLIMQKGNKLSITNSLPSESGYDTCAPKPASRILHTDVPKFGWNPAALPYKPPAPRILHTDVPKFAWNLAVLPYKPPSGYCGVNSSILWKIRGPRLVASRCRIWTPATGPRCLYFQ